MYYTIANYIAILIYLGAGFAIGLLVGVKRRKAQHDDLTMSIIRTIEKQRLQQIAESFD